jgi:putative ABC transport system permease protein
LVESFLRDVRAAARWLAASPGNAGPAVLCLALGIGATGGVFSLVAGVLWRPLPFPDPERLVVLWTEIRSLDKVRQPSSALELLDYQRRASTLEDVAGVRTAYFNVTGGEAPERLLGARISASFFPLLGVEATLGRTFTPEEGRFGGPRVALLSEGLWRRRFGGDPAVVGRSLDLEGLPHSVVGVVPDRLELGVGERYEVWVPLALDLEKLPAREFRGLLVLARLAPGASLEQAQGEMDRLAAEFGREFPDVYPEKSGWGIRLVPVREEVIQGFDRSLTVLFGLAGLVLVISCGNVANLLVARAATRQKEVALRTALGAGRRDLARQLLAEGLVLAASGAALGLGLAHLGLSLLPRLSPEAIPRLAGVSLDGTVLAFTVLVALATGALFGLAPFVHLTRPDLQAAFKEGEASRSSASPGSRRLQAVLVIGEVALAAVVLVGAGLMVRSFLALRGVDPGFDAKNVLTFQLYLSPQRYPERHLYAGFYRQLLDRLAGLPGVEAVGTINELPLGSRRFSVETDFEGYQRGEGEPYPMTDWRPASPDYFAALGIPILAGRAFSASDDERGQQVAIVGATVAERFWPGQDPVGKQLKLVGRPGGVARWLSVVGVVGDVRSLGLAAEAPLQVYTPYPQAAFPFFAVVLRTEGAAPEGLANLAQRAVWEIDRDQPVDALAAMEELTAASLAGRRALALLMTLFAAVALLLVAVGVYSVMSYLVAQRTGEISIRLALGAEREAVARLVLVQVLRLAGLGLLLGLAAAAAGSGAVASQLVGVERIDPPTFAIAALALLVLALAAAGLPMRRALTVHPMEALRRT